MMSLARVHLINIDGNDKRNPLLRNAIKPGLLNTQIKIVPLTFKSAL